MVGITDWIPSQGVLQGSANNHLKLSILVRVDFFDFSADPSPPLSYFSHFLCHFLELKDDCSRHCTNMGNIGVRQNLTAQYISMCLYISKNVMTCIGISLFKILGHVMVSVSIRIFHMYQYQVLVAECIPSLYISISIKYPYRPYLLL